MNDKAINIKVKSELYEQLRKEAEKKGISMASLIRLVCWEYFEKNER